jgi:hypothetical protein
MSQGGFAPDFVNYKNGALDLQPQVIKFTSCLPMVGGSLQVLRLLPPLKLLFVFKIIVYLLGISIVVGVRFTIDTDKYPSTILPFLL